MKTALLVTAAAATTATAGPSHAPATLDETVPVSLASPAALEHRAIAEMLFAGLPADQQAMIAACGAIGPVAHDDAPGFGVALDRVSRLVGLSVEEMEAELNIRLSKAHRDLLNRFQDNADNGEAVPHLCLSTDTDPKLADALLLMVDAITRGGDLRYQAVDRWTSTATNGPTGSQGNPIHLTWSIVPDGTSADGETSDLFAWLNSIYAGNGGQAEWELRFDQTFARWSFLSGIVYTKVSDDGANVSSANPGVLGVRGDVRICAIPIDGGGNVLAYNYFPNHGDMFLDSSDSFYNSLNQQSRGLRNVLSHEHGHGIGLAHVEPVQQTKLMEPFVSSAFLGPQIDDRLGAQRNYGDRYENNDSLATAADLGLTLSDGANERVRDVSTDDNSDIDYYTFTTTANGDVTISLELTAGEYLMGPQGGTAVLTDYDSIHDLAMEIRDAGDSIIDSANNAPLGSDEVATFSLPAGTHYLRVFPANNTNNIQLHDIRFEFIETSSPCPADVTGDGVADNGDIGAFIILFLANDPAADFNNDGIIDNGDIGAFVPLFLAG
ncbi:MAG: matrixin family metalloprotease, partial [Phycisphaerales bacterium JB040]